MASSSQRAHQLLSVLVVLVLLLAFSDPSHSHSDTFSSSDLITSKAAPTLKPSQNLTKLHFYFHDIVSGANPTAVIIARPANATNVGFGTLVMIDDPLTVGPYQNSEIVGRAQGMYGDSAQQESSLIMALTFSFLVGKYNGSSISILGRYPVDHAVRELPIIGGSGVFRLARGYALARTYKYDQKTGDATSEYNVFVYHSGTSSDY